ncbi:MAG: hypothetical protein RMJ34_07470, partial [candidate division WOR-3 bacterium]|nr:hypothetical protein [candidate division WOR-3 bacterium]
MERVRSLLYYYQMQNEKKMLARYLAGLFINLTKKERRVFYHIGFRNMAEDGFCYEFYYNIAEHTGVHRNTIPKYVNLF